MAIKEYSINELVSTKNPIANFKKSIDGIDVLKISHFLRNFYKSDIKIKREVFYKLKKQNKVLEENDILISRVGTIGKVFIVDKYLKDKYISDNFIWLSQINKTKIIPRYLFFFFKKQEKLLKNLNCGSTQPLITKSQILNIKIFLPDIKTQQEIINIIEPFEKLIEKYNNKKMYLIKILNYFYELNKNENKKIKLLDFSSLSNKKYNNQKFYVETSDINDNYEMCGNKEIINKKPSRANLSVINNSLIFSKLKGSNKLFLIYDESLCKYVYSTGFYNIYSKENMNWYLFGFLNSCDFINQKNQNSSGTLMEGITISGLSEITLNSPKQNLNLNHCLELISKINKINDKLKIIIQNLIETYVM